MKTPEAAREQLKKRFIAKHREWLRDPKVDSDWPLEIALGVPSEADAARDIDAVGAWAQRWSDWTGRGDLVWTDRRWKNLGRQKLPEKLLLHSPEDVAAWAGQSARWLRAVGRYQALVDRWPKLDQALPRYFDVLSDYADEDFARLNDMLAWLDANPASGLYPRQLPVAGLDTKWLETRARLFTDFLTALREDGMKEQGFYERCGLRSIPTVLRMRLLDPQLRAMVGGLSDITVPLADLVALPIRPARILVVENLQTGLAFPDFPATVLFMGLGYGVDVLYALKWVHEAQQYHYWGDCDTHGFAILNRARTYIPSLQSVLMDESTLLLHRPLWVEEPEQHGAAELPLLTSAELAVYRGLKNSVWGKRVRLEQERISWSYALDSLRAL